MSYTRPADDGTVITVESYKDVWHHKAKADHLCDIFGVSQSDLVAIEENPRSVMFFFRSAVSTRSLVDSGKPSQNIRGHLMFAVIP